MLGTRLYARTARPGRNKRTPRRRIVVAHGALARQKMPAKLVDGATKPMRRVRVSVMPLPRVRALLACVRPAVTAESLHFS